MATVANEGVPDASVPGMKGTATAETLLTPVEEGRPVPAAVAVTVENGPAAPLLAKEKKLEEVKVEVKTKPAKAKKTRGKKKTEDLQELKKEMKMVGVREFKG